MALSASCLKAVSSGPPRPSMSLKEYRHSSFCTKVRARHHCWVLTARSKLMMRGQVLRAIVRDVLGVGLLMLLLNGLTDLLDCPFELFRPAQTPGTPKMERK